MHRCAVPEEQEKQSSKGEDHEKEEHAYLSPVCGKGEGLNVNARAIIYSTQEMAKMTMGVCDENFESHAPHTCICAGIEVEIVIYNVYGDESSDEKKERIFTVAGLFGDEQQWDDFKEKWLDLTEGEEFHATEFEGKFPLLYKKLIRLLAKSGLMGWAAAMSLRDYSTIFDNPTPHLPYYICFTEVIQMFARRTKLLIPQGKVEFTFDRNLQTQYNATFMYDYMANLPEWEDREVVSGEIRFSSRKDPKIQAADLWVHEVKNYGEQCVSANQPLMGLNFRRLHETKRFALNFHQEDYYKDMKRQILEKKPAQTAEYFRWLSRYKMQDTTENRIRFHMYLDIVERQGNSMTQSKEHQKLDKAMRELQKVPRSEVRMKLEEEEDAKRQKKSKASSASRELDGKD